MDKAAAAAAAAASAGNDGDDGWAKSAYKMMSSALKFAEWQIGTCTFKCPVCTTVHKGLKPYFEHMKYVHKKPKPGQFIRDSTYMVVKETIKCAMCGKVMDHNGWELKYHLENKHDEINLVAYFDMYIDTCDEVTILE